MNKKIIYFLIGFLLMAQPAWAADGVIIYTARKDDSISKIAKRYHQSPELIAVINNIPLEFKILSGERILIPIEPTAKRVVLKKGDNPWTLARRHGVTIKRLLAENGIKDPTRLMPGDVITIPSVENDESSYNEIKLADAQKKPAKKNKVKTIAKRTKRKALMRISYRGEQTLIWPLAGPITSGYGTRWGDEFHHGVDIAADMGTVIVAAAPGKVVEAGYKNRIYGKTLMIQSGAYTLLYAHCSSFLVEEGQEVVAGQAIARVGETGRATGPHLHFEVRSSEGVINPLKFLP